MKHYAANRNYVTIMITLSVVIALTAIYFFVYIPQNEKTLQEQRFRTLQRIDKNIHARISTSLATLNNLLAAYNPLDSTPRGDSQRQRINTYAAAFSSRNYPLSRPETSPAWADSTDSVVHANNTRRELLIQLTKRIDSCHHIDSACALRMNMRIGFDQFIQPLLVENVFDQFIVFSNEMVVFETFPSGISYDKDSLLRKKNGIVSATMRDLTIGGVEYKIFLQPVGINAENNWVLGGLLSAKRYDAERNQLPPAIVQVLVVALMIILVAFPSLKLIHMGNRNRLTTGDAVAAIVASIFIMSFLIYALFRYNAPYRPNHRGDPKEYLSNEISDAFMEELDTALNTVQKFDSLLRDSPSLAVSPIITKFKFLPLAAKQDDTIHRSPNIVLVFWLRSDGSESRTWTTDSIPPPSGNYKDRNYYKKIVSRDLFRRHGDEQPFYLDQVVSWVTGTFTSVVSIPSKHKPDSVAVIGFDMKCMDNPVLPAGYLFAIVDKDANVLYHSNSKRNLTENLIEEFSEGDRLRANMQASAAATFTTRYFSKEYNVFMKPMPGLPYFIVVLCDIRHEESRSLQACGFALSMMLFFFLFQVLQLAGLLACSERSSFLRKQSFETSWLMPRESAVREYSLTIVFRLVIIILLIISSLATFLTYLNILLVSITASTVFPVLAFPGSVSESTGVQTRKKKVIWAFGILTAVINIMACTSLDPKHFFYVVLYQLGLAVLTFFLHLRRKHIYFERLGHRLLYSLTVFARLCIASGIPVAFAYISAYNFEGSKITRQIHAQYGQDLRAKVPDAGSAAQYKHHYYTDNSWVKDISDAPKKLNAPADTLSCEQQYSIGILQLSHLNLKDQIADNEPFGKPAHNSSLWYNATLPIVARRDSGTVTQIQTASSKHNLQITAATLNYRMPEVASIPGLVFYVLLVFALLGYLWLLHHIIRKLFCFDLPDISPWRKLDDQITVNPKTNSHLFIVGLPGSNKIDCLRKTVIDASKSTPDELRFSEDSEHTNNVILVDFTNIPDSDTSAAEITDWERFKRQALSDRYKLIIVNHFEYNIQDEASNTTKLNFLESLMVSGPKQKVMILSTIHPVSFLDSIIERKNEPGNSSLPGEELERWHVLLGHYRIIIYPLAQFEDSEYSGLFARMSQETMHGKFLWDAHEQTMLVANQTLKDRGTLSYADVDKLALKMQISSHYYYMYIWQSLTNEEKFLLYDLAEDNLVNCHDLYNLNMLVEKGVIVREDGLLRLFNKGFRNFILTAIGNIEMMKLRHYIKDNGNWGSMRVPLFIVIVAILVFLFASEQEAYSKLVAYIAALGTAVPALLNLANNLRRNKSESKSQ